MKTVIMAGGRGTRISELFPDIPKPLIPVTLTNGEKMPVLEWELRSLREQGFTDIILTVSHMAEKIRDYFDNGSRLGMHIDYFVEEKPLGNAGALFKLDLRDDFLLLNADSVFDVDFNRFVDYHRHKGGLVTLFTHPNSHPYDSGLLITGADASVELWLAREDPRPVYYHNCVNAGLHIINPKALEMSGINGDDVGRQIDGRIVKIDLDRQVLKPLCGTKRMYSYQSPEYVKDMGTPERFAAVCRDFRGGLVAAKNLKNRQRAIFLDRDGTLNKYVGFLRNVNAFELLPGVADAVRRINDSGYLAICVTNQPVVARGEVTVDELDEIHRKMETLLGAEGAYLDAIYYCPHHPHRGYPDEVPELKIDCECRKPKPGMLLAAARDYNIDLDNSWMIGDGENDIKAGKAAGCWTALLGEGDYGQDLMAVSLLEAMQCLV